MSIVVTSGLYSLRHPEIGVPIQEGHRFCIAINTFVFADMPEVDVVRCQSGSYLTSSGPLSLYALRNVLFLLIFAGRRRSQCRGGPRQCSR